MQRMGHDGTMFLDSNALLVPSNRIVMEVGFEGSVPPSSSLYFRGSTLYIDKQDHWEPIPKFQPRESLIPSPKMQNAISYKVTLYPTQKKWLYLLDMPSMPIDKSTLDRDLISTVKKDIKDPIHYEGHSSLGASYTQVLDDITYKASTQYSLSNNPQTYQIAQKLKAQYPALAQRATAIEDFFKAQALTYTLKPDALDTNNSTDSFLFDKRKGYCVHFAASFVTMSRMAGIPARLVTGYKSSRTDNFKNYLAVREKDAHAWTELYIGSQWIRYETTTTASFIDEQSQALLNQKNYPWIEDLNIYLMYVKYQVETWILYYSHVRQMQLLAYAKSHPTFIVGFVLSILTLIFLSFIIVSYFRRPIYSSKALEILQPLLKSLHKKGYQRADKESMHQFLLRYQLENPSTHIAQIDHLYQALLYGNTKDNTFAKMKMSIF
ncbi:MAG: DUF3488 and transglutaminase-like domain-containing protein [Sulfurovum sp.]|nr:DUF3488 and transglutaminase-like domain-containing protein [Sulfurovum sp.]